jgi:uncharacterized iron-regulated protein
MTPSMPAPVALHFHSNPFIKQAVIHALRLLVTTVFIFCFSKSVSADSHIARTSSNITHINKTVATDAVINLPVVKLEQTRPLAQTVQRIDDTRLVLVGETHTRYDHHLIQLEVLKLLYQKSPKLALGVEWFQQPFQKNLDAYIAGEMSEEEMLHQTGYFERWRYDYRLYRPIMQYARAHKIPVIALNASQELTDVLSESGFDDITTELKTQLPESYDWSDKAYEKRLRDVFDEHPEYPGDFEGFLRVQITWDESMAERAAQYLKKNPENRLLIFAGSGHIMFDSGIPNRIKRRIDVEPLSILVSEDLLPASENIADFLVLSAAQTLQPAGLIGALLETKGKLVTIKGFSDNSAVKDAGVEKGAVIIKVDNETVESFADFKLAIMDKKPGDSVELHYLENAQAGNKAIKSVNLELR